MGPIDYSIDVQTPFQSALQGYQAGAAIRTDQQQQAQQKAAQDQQLRLQQAQRQVANTPSAENFTRLILADPKNSEAYQRSWNLLDTKQQQAHASDLLEWGAAIKSGNPQLAVDRMMQRADIMDAQAGGPTDKSKALRANAQAFQIHPELALGTIQAQLATNPNGKQAADSLASFGTEARAEDLAPSIKRKTNADASVAETTAVTLPAKAQAEIANVSSQIQDRSKRLALDQDKLETETKLKLTELNQKFGELPESVAKDVNTAVTDSIAAQQSASKMLSLAGKLEAAGGGFGGATSVAEWFKKATGNQNEITRLRAEYNRIATPSAMAAYKKVASGSTSDKDIETAMLGVPKDNADAATLGEFLRGAAKLQVYDSVFNNARAEWQGSVRSLGKAPRDLEIDGVKVPAGTTFKQFSDEYVSKKAKEQIGAMTVQNRGYMKYATPQGGAEGQY